MPNHVQNRLQAIGETKEIKRFYNYIKSIDEEGKEMQIDFRKIKPRPEALSIDDSTAGEIVQLLLFGKNENESRLSIKEAQKIFSNWGKKMQEEGFELALKYQENVKRFGHRTWYSWSIENWGTKWNAYSQNDNRNTEDVIYFQTAWSSPIDLIVELSKIFPTIKLFLTYADEDSGYNTGKIYIQNGKVIEDNKPQGGSKEGYEIYFELNPDSRSNYKITNGEYKYIEE
jgi:hypothetical protein